MRKIYFANKKYIHSVFILLKKQTYLYILSLWGNGPDNERFLWKILKTLRLKIMFLFIKRNFEISIKVYISTRVSLFHILFETEELFNPYYYLETFQWTNPSKNHLKTFQIKYYSQILILK